MKIIPLLFLNILTLTQVFAQTVSIDQAKSFALPLTDHRVQQYPTMTQRPLATCYAHTSALILELQLLKMGAIRPGTHIDPIWLATDHKYYRDHSSTHMEVNKGSPELSRMTWAIHDSLKDGLCPKDVINKAMEPYTALAPHVYPEEVINIMMSTFDPVVAGLDFTTSLKKSENYVGWFDSLLTPEEAPRVFSPAEIKKIFTTDIKTIKAVAGDIFVDEYSRLLTKIKEDISKSKEKTFLGYLKNDLLKDCDHQKLVLKTKPVMHNFGSLYSLDKSIMQRLDGLLTPKDPKYLAVGYCSSYVEAETRPKTRSKLHVLAPRILRNLNNTEETDCGEHYAMLMGKRKYTNGKMDFLIMNNHGPLMMPGNNKGCVCKNTVDNSYFACHKVPPYGSTTEVHSCWYDGELVVKNVFDVIYFD
jgi:hypothetical protein